MENPLENKISNNQIKGNSGSLLENTILVILFLSIYGLIAYYFLFILQLHNGDALSRTANGYFVVYSREAPHLSAAGFVWQPLMSLLQIPFFPFTKWIGEPAASGPLLTVIFGALTLPVLNQIGIVLGIKRIFRLISIFLYGINPTIILFSSMGYSETIFFFFMSIATLSLILWALQRINNSSIIITGIAIALAFWIRYEAIALSIGFALSVLIVVYIWTHNDPPLFKGSIEAVWISLIIPTAYSAAIWMFVNWLIQGDPLFFYRGEYQQIYYSEEFFSPANVLYHDLFASAGFILKQVTYSTPIFPILIIVICFLCLKRKTLLPLIPFTGPFAVILFHVYQNFQGFSWGWYRFASYMLPATIPIVFWIMYLVKDKKTHLLLINSLLIVGLLGAIFTTSAGMITQEIAKEETPLITSIMGGGNSYVPEDISFSLSKKMASYINNNNIEGPILLDTYSGFVIFLYADNPKDFIITPDTDFKEIINDPIKNEVKWIIISDPPKDEINIDLIRDAYPGLLEGKIPWAVKEKQFSKWYLFKVVPELADG